MSTADGLTSILTGASPAPGNPLARERIGAVTLAGTLTLTLQYRPVLRLDPGGSGRDVNLPAENVSDGLAFEIVNAADSAETLTVKDDGGGTIVAIAQNEKATVVCDGTTWYHTGIITIALS